MKTLSIKKVIDAVIIAVLAFITLVFIIIITDINNHNTSAQAAQHNSQYIELLNDIHG